MNERLMEGIAARLEYKQAERDFKEAFKEWNIDRPWGCAQDVSVWSTSAYANAAQAVMLANPARLCDFCDEHAVEIDRRNFRPAYRCHKHV